MNRILRNIIAAVLLLTSCSLQAQVLVKASVDKDKILVGEPIVLTLDVRAPLGQDLSWFTLDTIPHFEFISKGKIDTVESVDGKQWIQQVTITSYDSGYWQLPAMSLTVGGKPYFSDSLGISVNYSGDDLSQEYRDIKEIEEVAPEKFNYLLWILGAVTLIAVGIILYLLLKKKKQPPVAQAPIVRLTPYDEAMKALEELQKSPPATQEQTKQYYTRLNDILRIFIMRKLKIATLEKTNDELVAALKKKQLQEEHLKELVSALQVADFVKFARYQPGTEDNQKNFTTIQTAIKTLNNTA